ncbi:glycosyltransferase [Halomonas gemina]|uniref:glycosyltransferase n=1 Tax=Halomonas gemina TaxID=2945105 RepID=UPI003D3336DC
MCHNNELTSVDDCSIYNNVEIFTDLKRYDQHLKMIRSKKSRIHSSRKSGVTVANGELIGLVDSDDWVKPAMYM